MRRGAAALFLALVATASCGPAPLPLASTPDDPSTVRVIVFMRDQSGTQLTVSFPSEAGGQSGHTSGVTKGVAVACEVIPAGATVAVVAIPGFAVRLPLYTTTLGAPDKVLWVDAGPGGDLRHGDGRPDWGTVTPECPAAR